MFQLYFVYFPLTRSDWGGVVYCFIEYFSRLFAFVCLYLALLLTKCKLNWKEWFRQETTTRTAVRNFWPWHKDPWVWTMSSFILSSAAMPVKIIQGWSFKIRHSKLFSTLHPHLQKLILLTLKSSKILSVSEVKYVVATKFLFFRKKKHQTFQDLISTVQLNSI